MTPTAVYIHVPFCARRCSYCDFAVTATREPPVTAWLDAVETELAQVIRSERLALPLRLDTIYVGGGTPSLLGGEAMRELRLRLARYANWDDRGVEWTAEANPESFDAALAAAWLAAGVNRLSLGAQTFHLPTLRWMGRLHGADGPALAVGTARQAGFGNISVDLIFGVPDRLGRSWSEDLERAIELSVEHISLYGLTAEAATPLGRWVREGREELASEDMYAEQYLEAATRLTAAGYVHYEVSNFARPGCESRHNGVYWRGAPYIGVGPGAHSYLPTRRWWNTRDWADYALRLGRGESPREGAEDVVEVAADLERVWLGLRTLAGLEATGPAQRALVALWLKEGWAVEASGGRVRLTPSGWLLLDRLAVEFEAVA